MTPMASTAPLTAASAGRVAAPAVAQLAGDRHDPACAFGVHERAQRRDGHGRHPLVGPATIPCQPFPVSTTAMSFAMAIHSFAWTLTEHCAEAQPCSTGWRVFAALSLGAEVLGRE
ncbi:hypothetical protein [Actinophytocola sp.]|uniref:hypothetical protein n=1 Tax=Actinophytocola sp. TaxID=1872138 RepID=UPI0025C57D89|nr:hypothetical protein [Actinophytocola sp.]